MNMEDDEDDDSEASHTSEEQLESSQTVDSGNNRDKKQPAGKKTLAKFKKAPQAPRRFKSAFIFFSSAKHKEIRAQLADSGVAVKTTFVAKLVSKAWGELPPEEREKWEALANRDKARFEMEKLMYKGPWKVSSDKKAPKDPNAPKRPMSAFLAFSNPRRGMVKQNNPEMNNSQVSKALSKMWKEAPDHVRQIYINEEASKRNQYKLAMAEWKKLTDEEKGMARQRREEGALRAAEETLPEQPFNDADADDSEHQQLDASQFTMASYPAIERAYNALYQPLQQSPFAALSHEQKDASPFNMTSYPTTLERAYSALYQAAPSVQTDLQTYSENTGAAHPFLSALAQPGGAFSSLDMEQSISHLADLRYRAQNMSALQTPLQQELQGLQSFYNPASRAGLIASPSSLLAQYRSLLQGSTHGEQAADPIVTLTEDQIQFLRQGEEDAFRRFGPPGWNFPRNL